MEPQAGHISSARRLAMAAALAGATAVAAFVISPAGAQAPDGAQVFATAGCSGCHGAAGEGGIGPALAGNADLANAAAVLTQIIHGGGGMPPFTALPDDQIAAVANYIRNNWGNTNETQITVEEVAAAKAAPAPAAAPATPPTAAPAAPPAAAP